jgi:predicted PurR-regulated permease PerM
MIWEMALTIFLLVLCVLVILLIPMVLNFNRTLSKLSKTLDTVNKDLPDIMVDLSDFTYNAANSSEKISETIGDIAELEHKMSQEIKQPLLETAATLGGFLQGLQAFLKLINRKSKKS